MKKRFSADIVAANEFIVDLTEKQSEDSPFTNSGWYRA